MVLGFAAQYFFGASTGGSMIMEGILELILGLFLARSMVSIFGNFPVELIGVMLLFSSLELGKFILTLKEKFELIFAIAIGVLSFFTNLGIGFFVGIGAIESA